MTFPEHFEAVLRAFNQFKVDYMVVGAYALNFHGYNRSTNDIDIWTKPSDENKEKVYQALNSVGFSAEELKQLLSLDFSKSFLFSIGEKPDCIEIFNTITGVKYEDAERNRIIFEFSEALAVNFIDWRELVLNKMMTGRDRDKADVEELQKILQLRK
jgi:hypothetical protein